MADKTNKDSRTTKPPKTTATEFSEVGNVVVKTTENGKTVTHTMEHKCSITSKDNPLMSFVREDKTLVEIGPKGDSLGLIIAPEVIDNIDNDELKDLLKTVAMPGGSVILDGKNDKAAPIKINSTQNQFVVTVHGNDSDIKEYKCTITPIGITFECEHNGETLSGKYRSPELQSINVKMSQKFVSMALNKADRTVSGLTVTSMPRHVLVPSLEVMHKQHIAEQNEIYFNMYGDGNNPPFCSVMAVTGENGNPYYMIKEVAKDGSQRNFVVNEGKALEFSDMGVVQPALTDSKIDARAAVYFQINDSRTRAKMYYVGIPIDDPLIAHATEKFFGVEKKHTKTKDRSVDIGIEDQHYFISRSEIDINPLNSLGGRNKTRTISEQDDEPSFILGAPPEQNEDATPPTEEETQRLVSDQADEQQTEGQPQAQPEHKQANANDGAEHIAANLDGSKPPKSAGPSKEGKKPKKPAKLSPDIGISIIALGLFFTMFTPLIGPIALVLGLVAATAGAGMYYAFGKVTPFDQYNNTVNDAITRAKERSLEKENFLENERAIQKENSMINGLNAQIQDIENDDSISDTEKLEKIALIEQQIKEANERKDAMILTQNDAIAQMDEATFNSVMLGSKMSQAEINARGVQYANGIVRRAITRKYSPAVINNMLSHYGQEALNAFGSANEEYVQKIKDLDENRDQRDETLNKKANYDMAMTVVDSALNSTTKDKTTYDILTQYFPEEMAKEFGSKIKINDSTKDGKLFKQLLDTLTPEQCDHVVKAVNDFEYKTTDDEKTELVHPDGVPRQDLWNTIKDAVNECANVEINDREHQGKKLAAVSYKDLRTDYARQSEQDVQEAKLVVGLKQAEYHAGIRGGKAHDGKESNVDKRYNKSKSNKDKKIITQTNRIEKNKIGGSNEVAAREKLDTKIAEIRNKSSVKPLTEKQQKKAEKKKADSIQKLQNKHDKKFENKVKKSEKAIKRLQRQERNMLAKKDDSLKAQQTVSSKKIQERSGKFGEAIEGQMTLRAQQQAQATVASEAAAQQTAQTQAAQSSEQGH